MNREHAAWVAAAVSLLIVGLLIGRLFLNPPDDASVGSFRKWFWESRSLDLLIQAGLVFAGALGIAALLPKNKEEEK